MGLRCLIGHEYGDPQTSRDRRQRGSEVVVTVEEYRECTRCGHRRIISENKEVTAEPPAEPDSGSAAEVAWSPPAADAEPDDDPVGSEVGAIDEPLTADEDDGIILEDDPVTPPRSYGQWPETDLSEGDDLDADHDPWPEAEDDAPVEAGEGAGTEGEQPTDTDESAAGGGSPAAGDASAETAPSTVSEASAEPSTPTLPPNPSEAELVCPGCGETWPSVNASLRPGDICPECRDGYLEERVIQ